MKLFRRLFVFVSKRLMASLHFQTTVVEAMVEASSASQAQASAVAAASPKSASNEAIQMPNLDSFAAKLNSFAVVLSEKAKSRPVTVGNVGEIESAIAVKKVGHRLFVKQRVCLI